MTVRYLYQEKMPNKNQDTITIISMRNDLVNMCKLKDSTNCCEQFEVTVQLYIYVIYPLYNINVNNPNNPRYL